jgi:hypothetical protein
LRRFETIPFTRKRLDFCRAFVAEHPRNQANDRIDHDSCRNRAIGEHVVADRNFFIHESLDDSVIHAFIMTTEEDEVPAMRQFHRLRLAEGLPLRSE